MDEKYPRTHRTPVTRQRGRAIPRFLFAALTVLGLLALFRSCIPSRRLQIRPGKSSISDDWVIVDEVVSSTSGDRPSLEAHIMSKCPDARDCLHDLVLPAMERISPIVNFTLSYIGTPTDDDDGVVCKHGPAECMGNMLELCAAHLYPDPKIYLGFTMCLFEDYQSIPQRDLVHDCALEHGMSFEDLNECVSRDDGAFAIGLLRDSVTRSNEAGVTLSCTVRLNERIWCIRDGGEWKYCDRGYEADDLVRDIQQLYNTTS